MSQAKELLFLAHRIPYPPNKGDKIRSFNILKHLAKTYRVHVGAFVDDPYDWKYKTELEEICAEIGGEIHLLNLKPSVRKISSLRGILSGQSLTIPYYASQSMQRWVNGLLARRSIEHVLVFSSPMAQFVSGPKYSHVRRVADFVDIDSDKWAQYAKSKSWPLSWLYRREARTLLAYESNMAAEFDATVFVSEHESDMFKKLAPISASRCFAVHNGVDTDYFSPERDYPNPYKVDEKVLVFTGAMDYWANVDAVSWFAKEIFPKIREKIPNVSFYIVGARPTPMVKSLEQIPGVFVTGSVEDIRPYLVHANLSVAPMRIARGVQNKVLEAMAMATSVLASPEAAEGLTAVSGKEFVVEDSAEAFINRSVAMLKNPSDLISAAGRDCVLKDYSWMSNLSRLNHLLEDVRVGVNYESTNQVVNI